MVSASYKLVSCYFFFTMSCQSYIKTEVEFDVEK